MARYLGNIAEMAARPREKLWLLDEEDKPRSRVVGVIPDLHFPFHRQEFLEFLVRTFTEKAVTDIVFIGDLVDNYQASDFPKNPEAMNIVDETDEAKDWIQKYASEFPVARVLKGNHDFVRIDRRTKEARLPTSYLRTFREIFDLPDTWEIDDEFIIDNVRYTHGEGYGGQTPALQAANITGVSNVLGHIHTAGGVWYTSSIKGRTVFGLSVGCLIDEDSYAFAYARTNKKKNILGCGVVHNEGHAEFIPFGREKK